MKAWFNMKDVLAMYRLVKGSSTGINSFEIAAKQIGTMKNGAYIFTNEARLYHLFEERLGPELKKKGIDCWGRLVQLYS